MNLGQTNSHLSIMRFRFLVSGTVPTVPGRTRLKYGTGGEGGVKR